MAALFIAVDGPDGVGKSTLVEGLAARLRQAGRTVLVVREPGGTATAEAARALVLDPTRDWTPAAELFLILVARAELVAKVLRPTLERGDTIVISDRYDLSTRAYQIAGRGLPPDAVLAANRLATGGLVPDLTFVLDLAPADARARQAQQGKRLDRMERADAAMHERVAQAFRQFSGDGVVHLDARRSAEAVEEEAWRAVAARLGGTK